MQSERYINSAIGDSLLSQIIPHISANMAILNLQGVPFHPVVVVDLGYDFLFKSLLGHCVGSCKCQGIAPFLSILPDKSYLMWPFSKTWSDYLLGDVRYRFVANLVVIWRGAKYGLLLLAKTSTKPPSWPLFYGIPRGGLLFSSTSPTRPCWPYTG